MTTRLLSIVWRISDNARGVVWRSDTRSERSPAQNQHVAVSAIYTIGAWMYTQCLPDSVSKLVVVSMDRDHEVCVSSRQGRKADTTDISQADAKLAKAYKEAKKIGKLTPLLKEELKCRIQARRHSEGKGELLVKFEEPAFKPESEMSPESLVRLEKRREQNRRASMKLRNKKKDDEKLLTEKVARLESDRHSWEADIARLTREKEHLDKLLRHHLCKHNCCQAAPATVIGQMPNTHNAIDIRGEHALTETLQVNETHRHSTVNGNLGETYPENHLMSGTHIDTDIVDPYMSDNSTTVQNHTTFLDQLESPYALDALDALDELPSSPAADEGVPCSYGMNPSYIDPINGIRSPDEFNQYNGNDACPDTLYSPAERKPTTTHFEFPEQTEMDLSVPNFNQSIDLEDLLHQYTCDLPLIQSCADLSHFNIFQHPTTP
ncbi:hypothetical protein ScPMuIL_014918 [Solemya velum]